MAASQIKFNEHEKRDLFLKIFLIGLIIFLANYLLKACDYVNSAYIDTSIANTYFFDSKTINLYYFRTDSSGVKIKYDEDNVERDRFSFQYEISDKAIVNIDFYDDSLDDVKFRLIKDGLLDLSNNKLFYKY